MAITYRYLTGKWVWFNGGVPTPAQGRIRLRPSARVRDAANGRLLVPHEIVVDLDVNGIMPRTPVVASDSDDIDPQNFVYHVIEEVRGVAKEPWNLFVPKSIGPLAPSNTLAPSDSLAPSG